MSDILDRNAVASQIPPFEVELQPPKLDAWREGNTGIPGFTTFTSRDAGPHVALIALTHGNEIAGAIALARVLREGIRICRGRLTLGFANLAAFDRFDGRQPTASRFVEEDLNRIWDSAVLDGPRRSLELGRAREIRPLIDTVDLLLDLHSMLWPSDPLMLCGESEKGRRLAHGIGVPPLVVADRGHASGRRLIDYARFTSPKTDAAAVLIEAGQHWKAPTVDMMLAAIGGLVRHAGLVDSLPAWLPPPTSGVSQRYAEVTAAVTATSGNFTFLRPFRGGDMIPARNTLIALDGTAEIRTPHDDCLLVMPSLRPSRGHTAVRLARFAN